MNAIEFKKVGQDKKSGESEIVPMKISLIYQDDCRLLSTDAMCKLFDDNEDLIGQLLKKSNSEIANKFPDAKLFINGELVEAKNLKK